MPHGTAREPAQRVCCNRAVARRPRLTALLGLLLVLLVSGCTALPAGGPTDTARTPAACPTTRTAPRERVPEPVVRAIGGGSTYGNDALWVSIPTERDGSVRAVSAAEGLSVKFAWVRLSDGALSISTRRLDGQAPPAGVSVPEGYGAAGFQPSGITFPSPGCWEVVGRVAGRELRFVAKVQSATG